ncbi:hypothetical protein [Tortoise microvirus 38]|nr:hypothetical protein [Tortoise microvirus 38]
MSRAEDAGRGPVSTYSDALVWLFTHSRVEEWAFDREAELPKEAQLVCDMFWVNSVDLKRDLKRIWNDALGPSITPLRPRKTRSVGWR